MANEELWLLLSLRSESNATGAQARLRPHPSNYVLTPCKGTDDQKRFGAIGNACWKPSIRRIVGQVFLAREEPDERASLMCGVIADRPAEYGVLRLQRVEY